MSAWLYRSCLYVASITLLLNSHPYMLLSRSDMGIETTWMRKGKGPEGIIGSTNQPETIRTFAYSYHDCITLTSGQFLYTVVSFHSCGYIYNASSSSYSHIVVHILISHYIGYIWALMTIRQHTFCITYFSAYPHITIAKHNKLKSTSNTILLVYHTRSQRDARGQGRGNPDKPQGGGT